MPDNAEHHIRRIRRRGAFLGIALGALIGFIYFGIVSAVVVFVDQANNANDDLKLDLRVVQHENDGLRALINEIDQDNADLQTLSHGRSLAHPAQPYPAGVDPSVEPSRRG